MDMMNPKFRELVEALEAKHRELLEMRPVAASDTPSNTPPGGVYLFSDGEKHLYAGRTKRRIHERVRNQFGSNPNAASFPWLIAREATGRTATYKKEGSAMTPATSRSWARPGWRRASARTRAS